MKNCFEGYITPACAKCTVWLDGTDPNKGYAIGCGSHMPISWCESFKEEEKKADK